MGVDVVKHFSQLGRMTLCGAPVFGKKRILYITNIIEFVDCPRCLRKHAARQAIIAKSENGQS